MANRHSSIPSVPTQENSLSPNSSMVSCTEEEDLYGKLLDMAEKYAREAKAAGSAMVAQYADIVLWWMLTETPWEQIA